jgi:transposase
VINGAGGRRHWSVDDKSRIIAETLEPNAIISEVARRHGLRPQQVFAWCRETRKQAASVQQDSPIFVPAVVVVPEPVARCPPKQPNGKDTSSSTIGSNGCDCAPMIQFVPTMIHMLSVMNAL